MNRAALLFLLTLRSRAPLLEISTGGVCAGEIQRIHLEKTLSISIIFTQRHQPVAVERGNEVTRPLSDETEVLIRGKPAVHQAKAKLQPVSQARLDHLAPHLVLGFLTFSLEILRNHVAVLNRLFTSSNATAIAAPWLW